jgi:biotin synthase
MSTDNTTDDPLGSRSSPEYLRTSNAAALSLRLEPGRFYRDVELGGINVLLDYERGCHANCAYCGLARERPGAYEDKSFIRVDWPVYKTDTIIDHMAKWRNRMGRFCISQVVHQRTHADTMEIIRRYREKTDTPISVLVAPPVLDRGRLQEYKDAGVDMIGVGMDAVTERTFERRRGKSVRGGLSWRKYWDITHLAREIFGPWKVNCHVVVGLGDTDRQYLEFVEHVTNHQIFAYLFCFYPEPQSAMASARRPSVFRWRRIQLLKHLLEQRAIRLEQIEYNSRGAIVRALISPDPVDRAIEDGVAFMTNGCPDHKTGLVSCTRPFGSYRPGEPFRDYPFRPTESDRRIIRRQLKLDRWLVNPVRASGRVPA